MCISAVALSGKVANLKTPSGGLMRTFARDLPKSTPDPIAAAIDPVIGSHWNKSHVRGKDLLILSIVLFMT